MIYLIFFIGLLVGLGAGLWVGYSYTVSHMKDHPDDGGATFICATCQGAELAGNA